MRERLAGSGGCQRRRGQRALGESVPGSAQRAWERRRPPLPLPLPAGRGPGAQLRRTWVCNILGAAYCNPGGHGVQLNAAQIGWKFARPEACASARQGNCNVITTPDSVFPIASGRRKARARGAARAAAAARTARPPPLPPASLPGPPPAKFSSYPLLPRCIEQRPQLSRLCRHLVSRPRLALDIQVQALRRRRLRCRCVPGFERESARDVSFLRSTSRFTRSAGAASAAAVCLDLNGSGGGEHRQQRLALNIQVQALRGRRCSRVPGSD